MIVELYGPNCVKVSFSGSNLVRELLYLRLCCGHTVLAWLDLGDQDLHVRGDDQGAAEVEEGGGLQGEDGQGGEALLGADPHHRSALPAWSAPAHCGGAGGAIETRSEGGEEQWQGALGPIHLVLWPLCAWC